MKRRNFIREICLLSAAPALLLPRRCGAQITPAQLARIAPRASLSTLGDGLIGHWQFEEGSGTTAGDSSSGGNAGTLTNSPTWVAGKVGSQALEFASASSRYVDYADIATFDSLAAITVAAWGKWNTIAAHQCLLGKFLTNGFGLQTGVSVGGKICFYINAATAFLQTTNSPIASTGIWYHVAATFDHARGTNKYRIYVNGVDQALTLNGTPDSYTTTGATTAGFQVGRLSPAIGRYFNGAIDDVRIYNRAIADTEVAQLAAM